MFTVLETLLVAVYAIERFCYAWSDMTVEIWETFTEYDSEMLVAFTELCYTVEYWHSPLVRWVWELI